MSKKCDNCGQFVYCWEDSWYNGNNFCNRDNEDLTPKKKDSKEEKN